MLFREKIVNVPPYCGIPRLSHQCPAVFVVATVVVARVVAVDVGLVMFVVVVLLMVVVWVDVDVVQEAKTNDVMMREVSTIQIVPLFI